MLVFDVSPRRSACGFNCRHFLKSSGLDQAEQVKIAVPKFRMVGAAVETKEGEELSPHGSGRFEAPAQPVSRLYSSGQLPGQPAQQAAIGCPETFPPAHHCSGLHTAELGQLLYGVCLVTDAPDGGLLGVGHYPRVGKNEAGY